jgi:transposase
MITPQWQELFAGLEGLALTEHSYPYQYQDSSLIKLFVYARIEGIKGFQTLQKHLELRADVVALLGLKDVPHRKTIAERFRSLPETVSSVLTQLTEKLIETGEVDASIASVDSTLMHASGNVWHKKQRDKGELPTCGNVDIEAHWGKSGCGEWIYGYRLHNLTLCGPAGITWPAAISLHAANVKDADVFDNELVQQLPDATQVLLGDGGYDQESCYQSCDEREVTLLAPIKVKKTRPLNVWSAPGSTKTPTSVKFLPYAKQPSNPTKVSSKTFST